MIGEYLPPIEYTPPTNVRYFPKADERKYFIVDDSGMLRRVFTMPCDLIVEE